MSWFSLFFKFSVFSPAINIVPILYDDDGGDDGYDDDVGGDGDGDDNCTPALIIIVLTNHCSD